MKHFLHASPKLDDSMHAAQQLARPLQSLALYLEEKSAALYPSGEDREFAAQFLQGTGGPVIALHPGSGSPRKNWPLQHWVALGEALVNFRFQISDFRLKAAIAAAGNESQSEICTKSAMPTLLLIGGEADHEILAALQMAWRDLPIRTAQDLPLYHLAAVIERCALFVGHDSGISHLAAAVGAPCVLLFGATDPEVWAPANPKVKIVKAPGGVLEKLSPELVKQSVSAALSTAGKLAT